MAKSPRSAAQKRTLSIKLFLFAGIFVLISLLIVGVFVISFLV